jgi:hypothetical protein
MIARACASPSAWLRAVKARWISFLSVGRDQGRDAAERAAPQPLVGQRAEPPLDQIEPRTRGGRTVQMKARMAFEPPLDPRVFVGGGPARMAGVVDDQMQLEFRVGLAIDSFEKANELLMPMPGHAIANDVAVEHAQGGKQCRGAMAFVVVGLSGRPTGPRGISDQLKFPDGEPNGAKRSNGTSDKFTLNGSMFEWLKVEGEIPEMEAINYLQGLHDAGEPARHAAARSERGKRPR